MPRWDWVWTTKIHWGEGLRKHLDCVGEYFEHIRHELPGLVVENCASGGMRLEPSMMARTDLGSFTDAHECREIPIIAAGLQRLIFGKAIRDLGNCSQR